MDTKQNNAYLEPFGKVALKRKLSMPAEAYMTDQELEVFRRNKQYAVGESSHSVADKKEVKSNNDQPQEDNNKNNNNEGKTSVTLASLKWREPPKSLPKPTLEYGVEFPRGISSK